MNDNLSNTPKSNIKFVLPSSQSKEKFVSDNDKDNARKDRLMKLIIDTKDEAIELKVKGDQYRRVGIHDEWRQVDFNAEKATYFSYQEKAAKDFIFRFNKCGILSDQVGMGKTIEAGMIISELAYRKELGSLLILVPNENMAEKWEIELARKFGFRNFYKDLSFMQGKEEKLIAQRDLPKVASIKSLDDVFAIVFTAYDALYSKKEDNLDYKIKQVAKRKFAEICNEKRIKEIRSKISQLTETITQVNSKEFKMEVLRHIYVPIITEMVGGISNELSFDAEYKKSDYAVNLSGTYYHIVDMYLDTAIDGSVVNGIVERLINEDVIVNSIVGEFNFIKAIKGKKILEKINNSSAKTLDEQARIKSIKQIREIALKIKQQYAILIVSKLVNYQGDQQFNLLSHCLIKEYEAESSRHCSVSMQVEKGYFLIDMLIDMSYKTLIVDEAHDYIKVSHKLKMRDDIASITDYDARQADGIEFSDLDMSSEKNSWLKYYVFPLYNDYYFVEKDCMYLKVKALAERSFRKIFMTATPIKSDMIDFYLLYLLADNRETNIFNSIRKLAYSDAKYVPTMASLLLNQMSDTQKKALNYCTHEDIVIKYIYNYYRDNADTLEGNFENKILNIINRAVNEKVVDTNIIKKLCINTVRSQFQGTFTVTDSVTGKKQEITSISALVSSDKGIEEWQNMYSQIGIRSTRHQTFRLDEEHLELVNAVQRGKYRNLPVWSRRNGTIIYINKKDNYFDSIVKEKLETKKKQRLLLPDNESANLRKDIIETPKQRDIEQLENSLNDAKAEIELENYSEALYQVKLKEEEKKFNLALSRIQRKYEPKEKALQIYNYINEQLTGKLTVADYYSTNVDYNDFKLHLVAMLMTDGLEIEGTMQKKKISGKVLLFADTYTQKLVLQWLTKENDPNGKKMTDAELSTYFNQYKHYPLWYYNQMKANDEDKWIITTDIKALKEKKGNYLIVVEPNKYEEGVDLQSSNTLINFDIKFCPLKMEQRIGRIDRVKLGDEQPQLDIISFTPLNDMSGFMVDFLANELKMFSCWKGDTTGIVSMPLGDKPNSATFESAILAINEAYKNLYAFDSAKFLASCKEIAEIGKNFTNNYFEQINQLIGKEDQIHADFTYLQQSNQSVNKIIYNTYCTDEQNGDEGIIIFDALQRLAEDKACDEGLRTVSAMSNHINNLSELKKAINSYYETNINYLQTQLSAMSKVVDNSSNEGKIENANNTNREYINKIKSRLQAFQLDYDNYKNSNIYKALETQLGLQKTDVDNVLAPILGRFKDYITRYLDVLLNLFDNFCADVVDKASKMTRFISYLTIEEFRVMAGNYE